MEMRCKVIKITTPRKYLLNGLWFGGDDPKKGIVFVHGLGSSAFSSLDLITPLANDDVAVITFNNRGHDKVSKLRKTDKRKKKGYSSVMAGEAHEVFTDCVDDIQGVVNFFLEAGIKNIFLAGHSTGCQKSVYYLAQRGKQKLIKGAILMCPMSDYAGEVKLDKEGQLVKAEKLARKLIKEEKPHEMLPLDIWSYMHDAQRFLSLYTPDSEEEIFSYAQPDKKAKILRKVKIPTFILFAGDDEFRDRPIKKIVKWFGKNLKAKDKKLVVIENAPHNFKSFEDKVVKETSTWLSQQKYV
jgi:pimeloyl-ACP methyl ester carboxylesterase